MKKSFTPKEIMKGKGCYSTSEVNALSFIDQPEITIQTILDSEISISDKFWFVFANCDLTVKEKQLLNLNCAKINLAHYQKECAKNGWTEIKEIAELTQLCDDYVSGKITLIVFNEKRTANAYANAYAYANANAIAYAIAIAIAYAYAYAIAIAYAYANDIAYANAYAYAYANAIAYANEFLEMLKEFMK